MISIIVPVYNVEKWLEKCIESIVNQTYTDLEVILIDDGSTDNSGVICDKYAAADSRIKVIHIENGGVSNARNIGVDNVTGEWMMFLDSDDWLESDACERLLDIAVKNNAEIVTGSHVVETKSKSVNIEIEDEAGEVIKLDRERLVLDILYSEDKNRGKQMVCFSVPWGRIVKTNLIKDNGLKYVLGIHPHEDVIFNLALFSKTSENYFVNIPVVHYRMVKGSAMHSKSKDYFLNTQKTYYALKDYLYNYSDMREEVFCKNFKGKIMSSCIYYDLKNVVHRCNYNIFKLVKLLKDNLNKECYRFAFDEAVADEFGLNGRWGQFVIKTVKTKSYFLLALALIALEFKKRNKGIEPKKTFFNVLCS